ncbi:hypothetical protein [Salinibacterium sp. ZJ450]|uniref:hypothetical protein n=1 Tax=Salinibacterium sp. ZJ450 TaxID=2708338 RepID=UPI00141DBD91|nr:hypothetical protein [Salinibacterium sp. ZJ450]
MLLSLAEEVRGGLGVVIFIVGLLTLGAAAIPFAISQRGSRLGRWGSVVLAVGLVTFLPQFFGTPELRVAHGAVIALGCVLLAFAAWAPNRVSRTQRISTGG